jgi:hypothetical protein
MCGRLVPPHGGGGKNKRICKSVCGKQDLFDEEANVMKMYVRTVVVLCLGLLLANTASAVTLWSEDFQGFTSGADDGNPIVPQDSSWDLSISNADQAIANVADNKMKNLTTLPGWSLFGDLPDGEQVLAVRGFTQGGSPPDGIVTATKTLPALSPTQTTLTAEATIATFWNGNRWFTSEYLVQDAAGNNIVTFFLNMLSLPGASVYLNGTRLDEVEYPAAGIPNHTGSPHDYDWVMDFDNDEVTMFVDDVEVATVAMNADYSASDVAKVAARITPYTQPSYQGLSYYDNLAITEIPEPMTLSLLGLGGLALVRRRR